jgi:glycyl-tRNA synthetase
LQRNDFAGLKQLIESNKIKLCHERHLQLDGCAQFNLMFSTEIGSVAEEANVIYLRPETRSGYFCELPECAEDQAA